MTAAVTLRRTKRQALDLAPVRREIDRTFRFDADDDREILRLRRDGRRLPEIAEALDRDVDLVGARLVLLAHFGLLEVGG